MAGFDKAVSIVARGDAYTLTRVDMMLGSKHSNRRAAFKGAAGRVGCQEPPGCMGARFSREEI